MRVKLKSIQDILVSPPYLDKPDFDTPSFKFCSLEWAKKNTNKYVCGILDKIEVRGNHRHVLVDVKVHNLEKGVTPAQLWWHLDVIANPLDKRREEVHNLFITPGSLTEFPEESIEVDVEENEKVSFDKFPFKPVKIDPYRIYTYGRVPHRATPAYLNTKRLLIRLSETDVYFPPKKDFEPTYRRHSTA